MSPTILVTLQEFKEIFFAKQITYKLLTKYYLAARWPMAIIFCYHSFYIFIDFCH